MKNLKLLALISSTAILVGCSSGSSTSDEVMDELSLQVDLVTETTDEVSVVEGPGAPGSSEVDDPIESNPTTNTIQNSGSSTLSSVPTPFEGQFIQETTSLIELFIYEKRNDDSNVLIEHTQTQIELITEKNRNCSPRPSLIL